MCNAIIFIYYTWGYSSAGRARASHVRGQGFDPPYLHLIKKQLLQNSCFSAVFCCKLLKGAAHHMPLLLYMKKLSL